MTNDKAPHTPVKGHHQQQQDAASKQQQAAAAAAAAPPASPGSPGWTTVAGNSRRDAGKWGRGRGRGRGAAGGAAGRGGGDAGRGGRGGSHHSSSAPATTATTTTTTTAAKPRGRKPARVEQRKPSISSAGGDSNDSALSSDSDDDDAERSPSPPPSVPLTFWTHIVFLCPMADCPPDTVPTTNPTVALDHLKAAHGIEVRNPHHVLPYLDKYIEHWARAIDEQGLDSVATKSDQTTNPDGTGKVVYILGHDNNLEDKAFRERLQHDKLNHMLKIQEQERAEDTTHVQRKCLFCKVTCDNRSLLFKHMFSEHGFNIGLPDNLVEVSEFLETLQKKLAGLQCLYCEKIFKTSAVLRKHMRKKKHFKINPRNRGYDRFYIINYLEPGKNWEAFENERYDSDEDRKEEEWEDWNEEDSTADSTMCLFDESVFPSAESAHEHMKAAHSFDLRAIREEHDLDFYASIRLINYIRHQTAHCTCHACSTPFDTMPELTHHLTSLNHFTSLPPKDSPVWTDPQYLFPCYENDPLLMLDVMAADDENEQEDDENDHGEADGKEELRKVVMRERERAEKVREEEEERERERLRKSTEEDGEEEGDVDVILVGVKEVTLDERAGETA
ncbi:uncharacterized protein EV422DRAFT_610644 [Fimicolochytrium jonesii]|uniref:uncharacterized protein n=1 Tax=Fimicolochytrium jonesii TaxID=1396493 RepID=UPI0022FF1DEC|nr:uncharacterized protein EV422DRAFT_610644 [Fimicolochytrium jonesii]KAI8815862.1 hypothetical protein EV422DRAFT_610644 [Fimicolochytrium jonesii]